MARTKMMVRRGFLRKVRGQRAKILIKRQLVKRAVKRAVKRR